MTKNAITSERWIYVGGVLIKLDAIECIFRPLLLPKRVHAQLASGKSVSIYEGKDEDDAISFLKNMWNIIRENTK